MKRRVFRVSYVTKICNGIYNRGLETTIRLQTRVLDLDVEYKGVQSPVRTGTVIMKKEGYIEII